MKSSHYAIAVPCINCGFTLYYEIPIGSKADDFLKNKECTKCGCKIKEDERRYY